MAILERFAPPLTWTNKYYNAVLHKRLADTDAKIMQYYEKNGHVTGDVIRAFLDENYELLRPDSGKDFVEFAKELIKSKYDKGKIGVSSYKNHVSYLNKFSESHSHAARSFLKCFSSPSMHVVCVLLML